MSSKGLQESPQLLFFLVLALWSPQVISTNYLECGCGNWTKDLGYILDNVRWDRSRKILCCIPGLNANSAATITWTFQGKPLDQNSENTFDKRCNNRELFLFSATVSGNYTCSVSNKNGSKDSFTTSLTVNPAAKFLQKPTVITASKDTYATEGETVKFTCEAFVGNPRQGIFGPLVTWVHILLDGKETFPQRDVQQSTTMVDENVIRGTLEIKSVTEKHYGTYLCKINNNYGSSKINFTLIHGVSPSKKNLNDHKLSLVVGLAIAKSALWLLYCWWRCRWTLVTFYMEIISDTTKEVGYIYDVFIVHGEQAANWVREILLPTLESTYGYACFVPDRDMLGGEQYADSISEAMAKCRRMLVVISPCLLQSQWAKWALHQGINTCLTTQARIFAITLQELGNNIVTSETTGFLKTLQIIKRIEVPRSCGLQSVSEEPQVSNDGLQNTNNICHISDLKLSVPEFMTENCVSHGPNNQRLDNMITGTNDVSREKLNDQDDAKINAQKFTTVIHIDSNNFEDPGTPCSITPFILPSCKKSHITEEDQGNCGSAFNCMRNVCCGDPEIIFWQKVRSRLDPPAARQRRVTEETIA